VAVSERLPSLQHSEWPSQSHGLLGRTVRSFQSPRNLTFITVSLLWMVPKRTCCEILMQNGHLCPNRDNMVTDLDAMKM